MARRRKQQERSAIDTLPVAGQDYNFPQKDYGEPAIDTLPVAGQDYNFPQKDYGAPAIDTLPVAGQDYTIGDMGQSMAKGGPVRRGYANGGSADEDPTDSYTRQFEVAQPKTYRPQAAQEGDTVYGSTAPAWTPQAYQASMYDAAGYAEGGAVRRGYAAGGATIAPWEDDNEFLPDAGNPYGDKPRRSYAEGGTVYDDPGGAGTMPDYSNQVAERQAAEERARLEAERVAQERAAAETQRQTTERAAPVEQSATPQPIAAVAPQPARADVARQQDDVAALAERGSAPEPGATPATPWYRQVYDGLLSSFQNDTAPKTGFFDPVRDAAPPKQEEFVQRINPYDRMDLEKYGLPGEKFMTDMAETTKGSWIHKLLGGEKSYTLSELNAIQSQDPGRDIGGHLQEKWRTAELQGNRDDAERIQQTVRNGFNAGTSVGLDRLNNGDLNGGLQAFQHSLNMFTDDRKYELNPTTDGRVQVKITPEKPGMGEPTTTLVSPAQLRDLFSSNGGQFDHLMHNGVKESLDIATGQIKPLNLPNAGERVGQSGVPYTADRPGYLGRDPIDAAGNRVLHTQGGFHPDSPMGLMDRDAQSKKFGRPDREANEYAAKAQAAVQAGVPPDQVHQYLRTNGAAPQGQGGPSAPAATMGPDGRPVYAPQTNIPGATSPQVPGLHPETAFTGLKSVDDVGGKYVSAEKQSVGKDSASSETHYGIRPPSHFENPAADRPPPFVGYAYGERRAGSYAEPTNKQDYEPISKVQGPQPPPSSPAPTRDIFETARGGGRENLTAPKDYSREEGIRYNQRLAEQQDKFRPSDDTAYQARNRQLNEKTGYSAAMDKARADQSRQIAEANATEKARSTEAMKRDTDPVTGARLTTNQLAERRALEEQQRREMELKTAPAQVQAAGRENVANINQTGRLQTTRERNQSRETVATGQNQSRETVAAGQNQSRESIAAAQRQFLENKQTQDILARRGSDEMKAAMRTYNTKLAQGIKPDAAEVENYNTLVQAVQQEQNQPAAAAPVATDERPRLGQPAGAAGPPGPANPGYKWQHNPTTGEWRQAPV